MKGTLQKLHGLVFLLLLVAGAVVCFFLFLPWLALGVIPSRFIHEFRRQFTASINRVYFTYAAFILEYVCDIKFFVHAENAKYSFDDNIFLISNHRTRIDWMFSAWLYAAYLRNYPFLLIILKEELKGVPFFGWCMQIMVYIFLSRKRENDLPHIQNCLNYYQNFRQSNSTVFLFPEGTDLSDSNLAKNSRCEKNFRDYVWIPN